MAQNMKQSIEVDEKSQSSMSMEPASEKLFSERGKCCS